MIFPERISASAEHSSDSRYELSVVVPVYNEEPSNLAMLLDRLEQVLSPLSIVYEVIFVDDGGGTETGLALRELANKLSHVKLVILSRNFGELAALNAGLNHASGQAVVSMDSDLQDPPELLPAMIGYWRDGYDVVSTQQASRKDSWLKNVTAMLYYRILGSVADTQILVDAAEFRLLSRKALDALATLPEKSRFLRGLVPWIGFKQIVIPFHRQARECGQGHYTLGKLVRLALEGLVSFSTLPLYLIPCLGLVLTLAGIAGLAFANVYKLLTLFGVNLCLASLLFFLTGLQIFCIGIVAAYLTAVLTETRARPTYLVAERVGWSESTPDWNVLSSSLLSTSHCAE